MLAITFITLLEFVSPTHNGVIDLPSGNVTINLGDRVYFAGTGTDSDFSLTYLWNFGDPAIADSTLEDPGLVQFNNPGTFTVTFTVTDSKGISDSTPASLTVTVLTDFFGETTPDWTTVQRDPFNLIDPPEITNPVITASDVTDIVAQFVADPFLFYENDKWYIFFEVMNINSRRGEIGLATSSDGLHWTYDRIVFSENWHLSYPLVFKYNGEYYLIPESYVRNEVRLYRATAFPYNWIYVSTLVTGRDFVDPAVFYYDNMWWMFVSDVSSSNCYLFYSDNLIAGWTEHPMSPIVSGDSAKARPGGRSFVFDKNRIIRIAQKDDTTYGQRVRAFEVDILDETQYAEHEIPQSPILQESGSDWNAIGMHQFDPWWTGSNYWLCAVDGTDGGNSWSISIYIAQDPSAPNGVIDLPSGNLVNINVGDSVDFRGTGIDPDNNLPLSFLWNFGDPGIADSTEKDPGLVQFNNPGTYTVTFTVTDSKGFSDPIPTTRIIIVGSVPKQG